MHLQGAFSGILLESESQYPKLILSLDNNCFKTLKYSHEILLVSSWNHEASFGKKIWFLCQNCKCGEEYEVCMWVEEMNDSFASTYNSYKWNHTVCSLVCITSFIQYNVFKSSRLSRTVLMTGELCFVLFRFPF